MLDGPSGKGNAAGSPSSVLDLPTREFLRRYRSTVALVVALVVLIALVPTTVHGANRTLATGSPLRPTDANGAGGAASDTTVPDAGATGTTGTTGAASGGG